MVGVHNYQMKSEMGIGCCKLCDIEGIGTAP